VTGLELLVEDEPVDPELVEVEPALVVLVEPDELDFGVVLVLAVVELVLAAPCFASAGS